MSEPNVIVMQFKKLVSVSLKNESINLHIKRNRLIERELLADEFLLFESIPDEEFNFIENRVRVLDFDMTIKNDLLYEVMNSWQQHHRDIIYLSLCERWSDVAIGSTLNMSRSAVQRLKKKLHNELKEKLTGGSNEDK